MRKNFFFILTLVCSLGLFGACSDDDDKTPEEGKAAPVVEWPANPNFDAVEILPDMTGMAEIVVKAEGGIKDFKLNIASDVLTNEALGAIGLAADMDLVNDARVAEILGTFKIPVGDALKNATEVIFDVSGLIPLILSLGPDHSGNHVFTLNISDNKEQKVQKALTFHYTMPSSFTVSNQNLWANTAIITAKNLPEGAKVQYRLLGEEQWEETLENTDGTFRIEPTWTPAVNAAGLTVYQVDTKTGTFAGHTYQLRAVKGEDVVGTGDFETAQGDVIPNGDMSAWSTKIVSEENVAYPNASSENAFWDSGNNSMTKTLCTEFKITDNSYAMLSAQNAFGIMMASGNLFTGDFAMTSAVKGQASFGRAYTYTARPSALKLRCHVKVGTVEFPKNGTPKIAVGQQDTSRIMVCIVDWSGQHGVTSGLGTPTGIWDPATKEGLAEDEKIIGYGTLEFGESTAGEELVEVTIPIHYYDKEAGVPEGNFTLVIACATSKYGDTGNGCSSNVMKVDDFQWVY